VTQPPRRRVGDFGSVRERQAHLAGFVAADPARVEWLRGREAKALEETAHLLDLAGQDKAAAIVRREASRRRHGA
jgi:hypothetical protein